MKPILTTLVYCLRDGEVLLMERSKEPNLGLWTAPGGKIEPYESPYECACRELSEETGLYAYQLRFRGLITEVSPLPDWQWMLFIYAATDFAGELAADEREGHFQWWPLEQVARLPIPQADAVFCPRVTDLGGPFYHAKYVYDADLCLVEIQEHPSFD
jgi:ADP-ribose pyrophosphatase YjhB (NUDIX family)